MFYIDLDDETKNITLLLHTHKLTSWDYANSQTEHELKKIRQAQLLLQRIKEEDKQRKEEKRINAKKNNHHRINRNKEDDGPEL